MSRFSYTCGPSTQESALDADDAGKISLKRIKLVIEKRLGGFHNVDHQTLELVVSYVFGTPYYYQHNFKVEDVVADVNKIDFIFCEKIKCIQTREKEALESIFAFIASNFKASLKTHAAPTEESKAVYKALGLVANM